MAVGDTIMWRTWPSYSMPNITLGDYKVWFELFSEPNPCERVGNMNRFIAAAILGGVIMVKSPARIHWHIQQSGFAPTSIGHGTSNLRHMNIWIWSILLDLIVIVCWVVLCLSARRALALSIRTVISPLHQRTHNSWVSDSFRSIILTIWASSGPESRVRGG